jgi:hypothetical protein
MVDLAQRLKAAGVPYMVIGGAANLVWGEPRLTRDVDATVQCDIARLSDLLAALAPAFLPRCQDPEAFVRQTRVLPLSYVDGIPVDLIFAGISYERAAIQRARRVRVGAAWVRIATAEDLIVHKAISSRSRDYEDVTGIIRRQGPNLDRQYLDPLIRGLAADLERPDIWERYERAWVEAGTSR